MYTESLPRGTLMLRRSFATVSALAKTGKGAGSRFLILRCGTDALMGRSERPSRNGSESEWSSAFRRDDDADELAEGDDLRIGCSMLSRIRMQPRNPGAMRMMRCSLGYALTSDDDVARCIGVEGPSACWKAGTPSWRVMALPEQPAESAGSRANGHQAQQADEAAVELIEVYSSTVETVIEIDADGIEIVGGDS